MSGHGGQRILVIKLGALGDFILALGPARAIRAFHRDAEITLLTTAPFAALGEACPSFDRVMIDPRPRLLSQPIGVLRLRRALRALPFSRVYDLQTSDRSSFYFRLMGPFGRPEWSGIARGASHPHRNPDRNAMHTVERQLEQLRDAGVPTGPATDERLDWLDGRLDGLIDPATVSGRPLLLLVPGGAVHRPEKRWPIAAFFAIARQAAGRGWLPAVLGGGSEADLAAEISREVPETLDLTGHTSFGQLAALGRRATAALGNDTGPMHLLAAVGCRSVVLFSAASDPALTAPRGAAVTVIQRPRLADLRPAEVASALRLG